MNLDRVYPNKTLAPLTQCLVRLITWITPKACRSPDACVLAYLDYPGPGGSKAPAWSNHRVVDAPSRDIHDTGPLPPPAMQQATGVSSETVFEY